MEKVVGSGINKKKKKIRGKNPTIDTNAKSCGTDDNQNNRESKGRTENKTIFAPKYIIHNVYL